MTSRVKFTQWDGRHGLMGLPSRRSEPDYIAKQEMERRERILEERRRIEAKWRPKLSDVRRVVNFEAFKNHFHDLDSPDYAIEVLYAPPNLEDQIRHEQMCRRKEDVSRNRKKHAKYSYGFGGTASASDYEQSSLPPFKKSAANDKAKNDTHFTANASQLQDSYMHRIRIQSQAVLGHLASLLGETGKCSSPRTFFRPFKPLVYFQPQMKEILATLEEKWSDIESLEDVKSEDWSSTRDDAGVLDAHSPRSSQKGGVAPHSEKADDQDDDGDDLESLQSLDTNVEEQEVIMDSVEALRDMRCYVNFVDNEVVPLYTQFDGTEAQEVRFEDLWALFRVGDVIHMPTGGDNSGRYHEMWRVYHVENPEPNQTEFTWFDDLCEEIQWPKRFTIHAYYIDHDGTDFGAVRNKFFIEAYSDLRPIESLEVFPVRFAYNYQQLLASYKTQGENFVKYLAPGERHQAYNAWTLTRNPPFHRRGCDNPDAEILEDENGRRWRHPEYIESDLIIDMTEACQKNADWRMSFHRPTIPKFPPGRVEEDPIQIQQWCNGSRRKLAFAQSEVIHMSDGIEMRQRQENLKVDVFLGQRARGSGMSTNRQVRMSKTELREEDLILLPKRMFAYVLRERRFVPIDINHLVPVRRERGVFENLRIQKEYKDIVRGLVASHFEKKTIERKYVDRGTEGPSQDLIQGKGRGLVILLHGVPGVGKTATAEAVAMENQKPLFVVTCGDLGLSPAEVELSLTNMFRLANTWDCVLLLDEADVFLSQRSHTDMRRNALVSVFLRVLEYYNGILFLTTNRVASIDGAFKSRIHMSLYYPPLDKTQTRDIFRLNVAKLRNIEAQRQEITGEPGLQVLEADIIEFASNHYEDNARLTGCWNGRQIRNAFQIASSLAHNLYNEQVALAKSRGERPPAAPVLDRTLFEKVQMSTQSFDRHMKETQGLDSELPLRGTFHDQGKH